MSRISNVQYVRQCIIRFVYAHLHMKCRRAIVMEYFGEEFKANDPAYPCCDVCKSSTTLSDCFYEVKAVIQAVNDLQNSGEKKVNLYVQSKTKMWTHTIVHFEHF